ncbi:MAG: hypothetical protein IJK46_01435 [Prevotella sp.]|nr:hypothetical protein [Prevotella sp.]
MKKILFIIAMCTFALYPIGGHAQTNGHDGPHLIPPSIAWNISFNDLTGVLSIGFTRVITTANIQIYKDGSLVSDERLENIGVGSTFYYPLLAFGTGEYAVYIKIGENTILAYEITI